MFAFWLVFVVVRGWLVRLKVVQFPKLASSLD